MLGTYEVSVPLPEDQLVARCRAGDLDAFGQVYARYEHQVFRHAYYMLGHRDDADDIKQETFLRAYRAIASFRSDSSLLTWLLKICSNLCRDRIKQQERRPEVLYDPLVGIEAFIETNDLSDPQAALDRAHTLDMLHRALNGMPATHRNIIVLHELEGLRCKEIAEVLGCSQASAKVRVFRARRLFKERVESLLKAKE